MCFSYPDADEGIRLMWCCGKVKTIRQRTDEVILVDIEWASEFVACGESKETEEELNKKYGFQKRLKRVHGDRMFEST